MFAWSVVVCHLFCQSLPLGRKCLAKDALMPCQAVIRFNSHPENFCFIAPLLNVFYLGTSDLSSPPGWGAGPGNTDGATTMMMMMVLLAVVARTRAASQGQGALARSRCTGSASALPHGTTGGSSMVASAGRRRRRWLGRCPLGTCQPPRTSSNNRRLGLGSCSRPRLRPSRTW